MMALLTLLILVAQLPAPRGGELPWRAATKSQSPADLNPVSPREMLRLQGIDDSHLEQLRDGRPLVSDEDETLSQLMHRLPRIEPPLWEAWRQAVKTPWQKLAESPQEYRVQSFLLSGRARQIERIEILKELVPRYEYRHYYRVTLGVEGYAGPVVVLAREIPTAWHKNKSLDAQARVDALFLKTGEGSEAAPAPLYFAAARIGWLPASENATSGIAPSHVWLAQRGFDVSLFDAVRPHNGGPIGAEEGECFYQLLSTIGKATPAELAKLIAGGFDLARLLVEPGACHGLAYECRGIARRVQKVAVPERFRRRVGMDHYYEIDLFVPLDDRQPVRLVPREGEAGPSAVIAGEFPTTLCVARLPADLPEGENVRATVSLKGVFFKKWSYQSEFLDQVDQRLRQPSPLLIGQEPTVTAQPASVGWNTAGSVIFAVVVVLGISAVWIGAWRISRGDRQFQRRILRKYTRGGEPNQENQ